MFVIPCKYNKNTPFILNLVEGIRRYHPDDKIVVVDSSSEDKSYFEDIKKYNVIIEDIDNKNWMVGAYWHAYKKFPNEDFYFFMHDSMLVKGNMDYLKKNDLTLLCTFSRNLNQTFDYWGNKINIETKYKYKTGGLGCYGIIFFCKNKVMKIMLEMGADKVLPNNKAETGYCEGCYGFFLEDQGYDLLNCSLYGDVIQNESLGGRSGPPPHNTSWQFPIEKFYASIDNDYRRI